MKQITNFIYYIVIIFLLFFSLGLICFQFNFPSKYRLMLVMSDSMKPVLKRGDILIVKKIANYQIGDIITYQNKENAKITTTHRIVDIKNRNFITKGDANNVSDSEQILLERVLGKTIINIPFFGYPLIFIKTLPGFIFLIVIPATIIIYSEFINVKNEIIKLIKKRKYKKFKKIKKLNLINE